MIKIVAIGKKHEAWVSAGIERYQKRLRSPWDVQWVLLPHSSLTGLAARQEESERLLNRLDDGFVMLLDETGQQLDSPSLSTKLEQLFADGQAITIVIGGAYGVSEQLRQRADYTWSLSELVFPHQLVRLILVEQLYRAQQIATGGKYHHQ